MRTRSNSRVEGWQTDSAEDSFWRDNSSASRGGIIVVGLGPGNELDMTIGAREAIDLCDAVVGYKTYIDSIRELITDKEVYQFGMRKEIDRCKAAIEIAKQNKLVALVSSGDPGIYGMAGLLFELLGDDDDIDIDVLPGVSAVNAAASVLGAPIMHDFVVISLSNLLTPWEKIEARLRCAATADFVTAIYNPKSAKRRWQIRTTRDIFMQHRDPKTPVGIYQRSGLEQSHAISDLASFLDLPIDMHTTIIVGNSQTYVQNGRMITPRGYRI